VVVQLLCAPAELILGLLLPPITTDAMAASTRVTDALVAAGPGVLGLVTARPSSDQIQHVGLPPAAQTTRGPETFGP
jgi:hypothetical protein